MTADKPLFVTDLDGTLLGADSLVSPRSAEIITGLSERGAMITVATARTPATVEELLERTLTLPPAVVMTGAAMWHRGPRRYSDARLLPEEKALEVCRTLRAHGINPMVYEMTADGLLKMHFTDAMIPAACKFIQERSALELKKACRCTDPAAMVPGADIVLILAAAPTAAALAALPDVEAIPGLSVAHYSDPAYPGAEFIEVFTAGVDKARGLMRLREMTGATHVTVFGDSLNDIPMMRQADLAVAVDNAMPEVKDAADIVIGPNTEDSVARYILSRLNP